MPTKTTYCQCGAMIKVTTDSVKTLDGAMAIWWREHKGDGHGPATRAMALAGRRRNEYHGQAPLSQAARATEQDLTDDTLLTVDMSAVYEMMARRERAQDGG